MSKEICTIKARNKKASALVVGNTILPSRTISSAFKAVKLLNEKHVLSAARAEQNGHIEIKDGLPPEALKFLKIKELPEKVVADTNGDTELEVIKLDVEPVNLEKTGDDGDTDLTKKDGEADADLTETDGAPVEKQAPVDETSDALTEEVIHTMSGKDLKAYIAEKNLEIAGYSGMTTKEVKNAVLAFYNFDIIAE